MLTAGVPFNPAGRDINSNNPPPPPPRTTTKQVGIWTLVYSSSQAFRSSPFFATFQALLGRKGVAEKIFAFTDAFPNAKIGQARQIINEGCTELLSRVEMSVWPHR